MTGANAWPLAEYLSWTGVKGVSNECENCRLYRDQENCELARYRAGARDPVQLYRKTVWYKLHPRNFDYMRGLFHERYPNGTLVCLDESKDWLSCFRRHAAGTRPACAGWPRRTARYFGKIASRCRCDRYIASIVSGFRPPHPEGRYVVRQRGPSVLWQGWKPPSGVALGPAHTGPEVPVREVHGWKPVCEPPLGPRGPSAHVGKRHSVATAQPPAVPQGVSRLVPTLRPPLLHRQVARTRTRHLLRPPGATARLLGGTSLAPRPYLRIRSRSELSCPPPGEHFAGLRGHLVKCRSQSCGVGRARKKPVCVLAATDVETRRGRQGYQMVNNPVRLGTEVRVVTLETEQWHGRREAEEDG